MSSGPNNSQARGKTQVYAVVRYDPQLTTPRGAFTVKEILPTLEEADAEVERLSRAGRGGAVYFWQTTRLYSAGRHAHTDATNKKPRLRVVSRKEARK